MGGVKMTGIKMASDTYNLVKNSKDINKNTINYKYSNLSQKRENNKNLLSEQLAKRRSILGLSNISNSSSSMAVQNRLIDDTAKRIYEDEKDYREDIRKLEEENNNFASKYLSNVLDQTYKIIK